MVHVKDEGSTFDAPLDTVWKYLQMPEDHNRTHKSRNFRSKPLAENMMEMSWEANMDGSWVPLRTRLTALPPVGVAIEMLEGPMAGSKFFNIYTPMGARTGITVVGEFTSKMIPPAQLEASVRGFLEQVYNEDAAAIKALASKK
ncbi:MAG TPA: hypothetical protein VEH10_03030 [Thermoplasmata archaeon]|nr:hypothetical protein [Thermoplasmata archaeon]